MHYKMKHLYYILAIFLLTFSLESYGQKSEIYNKFLVDTAYTEWKEYLYSPNSYNNKEFLSEHTIKDLKTKTVVEKSFDYHDGITMWRILKYDEKWRILEEIYLRPDSIIESIERFDYSNGMMTSKIYNENGQVDTTTSYSYFPNGDIRNFRFIIPKTSNSFALNEHKHTYDNQNQLKMLELIEIENTDTVHYSYATYHYNKDGQRDSIVSFDKYNNVINTTVMKYENHNLCSIKSMDINGLNYFERYILKQYEYENKKQLIIVGYTNSYGYIKRIEIE